MKDVNVSKIINMIGELPLLCYYEEECFERNVKKIVCDCFGGVVITCKQLCSATLCAELH